MDNVKNLSYKLEKYQTLYDNSNDTTKKIIYSQKINFYKNQLGKTETHQNLIGGKPADTSKLLKSLFLDKGDKSVTESEKSATKLEKAMEKAEKTVTEIEGNFTDIVDTINDVLNKIKAEIDGRKPGSCPSLESAVAKLIRLQKKLTKISSETKTDEFLNKLKISGTPSSDMLGQEQPTFTPPPSQSIGPPPSQSTAEQ
jgi:DNA repair ATPase RecN